MNSKRFPIVVIGILLWCCVAGFVLDFGTIANTLIGFLGGSLIGAMGVQWAMEL